MSSNPHPDSPAGGSARLVARLVAALVPVLAVALMLLGVLLVLAGTNPVGTGAASFGWFAYAPLSNTTFLPLGDVTLLGPGGAAGIIAVIAGLVLLAFWSGYRTGRRAHNGRRGVGGARS